MKSRYLITLLNSLTEKTLHKEEDFMTFEEAAVFANHTRHRMGMEWQTISIIKTLKGMTDASPAKKA